jgi:hypothetical protein
VLASGYHPALLLYLLLPLQQLLLLVLLQVQHLQEHHQQQQLAVLLLAVTLAAACRQMTALPASVPCSRPCRKLPHQHQQQQPGLKETQQQRLQLLQQHLQRCKGLHNGCSGLLRCRFQLMTAEVAQYHPVVFPVWLAVAAAAAASAVKGDAAGSCLLH